MQLIDNPVNRCTKYKDEPKQDHVQSGASSQSKNGGAYFSAVSGSIKDPIAVP